MKTAVIYCRYSSDSQTEQSIEGQLRVCNEYAKSNDIVILDKVWRLIRCACTHVIKTVSRLSIMAFGFRRLGFASVSPIRLNK